MNFPDPPAAARAALDRLIAADPDLARIEAAAGPLPWRRRADGFPGLLQAIVGQMISNQAAAAIWGRLCKLPGSLDSATLLLLSETDLRDVGLSRPKVTHARDLAEAFADGRLSATKIAAMDDASAIAAITAVRGMGHWSAEIYLLFALGREDIFPAGDIAVAGAFAHLKGLPARPGPVELRRLAAPWQPWRSLAARLLWHHWRHLTGRPAFDDLPQPVPATLPSSSPPNIGTL